MIRGVTCTRGFVGYNCMHVVSSDSHACIVGYTFISCADNPDTHLHNVMWVTGNSESAGYARR